MSSPGWSLLAGEFLALAAGTVALVWVAGAPVGYALACLLGAFAVGAIFHRRGERGTNGVRALLWAAAALLACTVAILKSRDVPGGASAGDRQLSHPPAARVWMRTTEYCTSGTTASGTQTAPGTVAATLPFGTRVQVPGYGRGVVLDRGGLVGPGHLDLYVSSCSEATRWGSRMLTVRVDG